MPMCNLLEYSDNYSITFASLQNYYRNEIGDAYEDNSSEGKSFKNKTKIWGKSEVRTPRPPKLPLNSDGSQPPQPPWPQYHL